MVSQPFGRAALAESETGWILPNVRFDTGTYSDELHDPSPKPCRPHCWRNSSASMHLTSCHPQSAPARSGPGSSISSPERRPSPGPHRDRRVLSRLTSSPTTLPTRTSWAYARGLSDARCDWSDRPGRGHRVGVQRHLESAIGGTLRGGDLEDSRDADPHAASVRLARSASALDHASNVEGLAGVLDAVIDHADEADSGGHRRIPVAVDDPIELGGVDA